MLRETSYNPENPPSPTDWLELPEQEGIRVVSTFHMVHRMKSGNAKAHAAIHVIVENQVAMGFGPTVRAMARLQTQGLSARVKVVVASVTQPWAEYVGR